MVLLITQSVCFESVAQTRNGTFTDGLINGMVKSGIKSLEKPTQKWYGRWKYKEQSYHISPYERKHYADCLKRAKSKCELDTFSYRGLSLNLGIVGSAGLADYSAAITKGAYGFSIGMEYQPSGKAPVSFGFNLNTLIGAVQNTRADLSFNISNNGQPAGTFAVPLQVNITNKIFNGNGTLRVWLPVKYVQPYFQGLGGFFLTSTQVKFYEPQRNVLLGLDNDGLTYQQSALSDVSWCAGGALGLGINIADGWNFDLRATYLQTGAMHYYNSSGIKNWEFSYQGSQADFNNGNVQKSKVDNTNGKSVYNDVQLLAITLGLTFLID